MIKKEQLEQTKLFGELKAYVLNFYKALVRLLSDRLRKMNNYLRETFVRPFLNPKGIGIDPSTCSGWK